MTCFYKRQPQCRSRIRAGSDMYVYALLDEDAVEILCVILPLLNSQTQ